MPKIAFDALVQKAAAIAGGQEKVGISMGIQIKQDVSPSSAKSIAPKTEETRDAVGRSSSGLIDTPESVKELKAQILLKQEAQQAANEKKHLQPSSVNHKNSGQGNEEDSGHTDTEDSSSGSAVISEELRKYLSQRGPDGQIKLWMLEMELKIWNDILKWLPPADKQDLFIKNNSIVKALDELAGLYRQLMGAVTANTSGTRQTVEMERLERALSAAVNRFYDNSIPCLREYFSKYGSENLLDSLRASIFYHVTGRTAPPRVLEAFWEKGRGGVFRDVGNAGKPGAGPGGLESAGSSRALGRDGSSIPRNLAEKPAFHKAYLKQARDGERTDWSPARLNQRPGIKATLSFGIGIYSPKDLELAENFFRYLDRSGNLLARPDIAGLSQEAAGFLQGVMSMKAQCLGSSPAMSRSMGLSCCTAMEQLIHYSLFSSTGARSKGTVLPNSKGLWQVYNYMMNEFHKSMDIVDTMGKGLLFALSIFDEKKKDPSYGKSPEYSEHSGFFRETESPRQEDADRKAMKKALERDIRQYKSLVMEGRPSYDYRRAGEAWQMQQNPFWFPFPRRRNFWWAAAGAAAGIVILMSLFK